MNVKASDLRFALDVIEGSTKHQTGLVSNPVVTLTGKFDTLEVAASDTMSHAACTIPAEDPIEETWSVDYQLLQRLTTAAYDADHDSTVLLSDHNAIESDRKAP